MRIRKHAAKLLLGSGLSHHSPPPPPPSAADVIVAEELFLCQLNCSPWDVTDSNLNYFDSQEEEGEEGRGVTGNGFGFGGDQEDHVLGISETITSGSRVAVAEPYCYDSGDDAGPKTVKKKRRRRKKEDDQKKSIVVTDTKSSSGGGTGICKKNDGKGWHCKRPANPNHTLCDHHLNQLKSYSARDNAREATAAAAAVAPDSDSQLSQAKNQHKPDVPQAKINRKTKTTTTASDVAAASESAGDGYYYYSGFGPWRGKSRSNGKTAKVKETVEEGNDESESGEGSDAPVAGDDLDDDSDDDDNDDDGNVGNIKGRIVRMKRGRKPVKARSLKSLL